MPFTIQTRLKKNNDASAKEHQAQPPPQQHQQMQPKAAVENKYFLQFVFTKEHKYLLPFSRRVVNIDLQQLIDEYHASLSINCGLIDVLMDHHVQIPNKKVIRIIDETMDESDVLNYIT